MAFAVAELAFGYVNSSTAFLGSIILGNGINYAIIFISRYLEERASGHLAEAALERALEGVVKGTLIAAVCASGAYATLLLTSFRGFFQFGVMGASGVLFCWVATFTLLPAMLIILDRRAPAHETRRPPVSFLPFGRLLGRHAPLVLVASVLLTAASAFGLRHYAGTPFEYDFRKLNTRLARSQSAEDFGASQEKLFGRWPSPTVILADRIEEIEAMRQAIRRQDAIYPGPNVIDKIVTVFDVLPGHPADQERKLALIRQIHKLAHDPLLEALTPEERADLDELDVPPDPRVLSPADLPPLVRRLFTEVDGTIGRVMLVYPPDSGVSLWNGRDLLRIAGVLQHLELPEQGKTVDTSGREVVFAGMLRSILRDGPRATIASLGLVLLLMLIVMRPFRAASLAMVSLLLGVLWMVGAAGFAEVKITFVNFIALPITFGIGVEYALNVVVRDRENRDMVRAVATTGGAVFLCSWTTIVGYGSLLAARNRALQGFGAMAILGEVACLVTAIVAMPAAVLWWRRLRARPAAAVQPSV
jgi:uncharacterized membrane protein YdfJ with MMPL/SSD domain